MPTLTFPSIIPRSTEWGLVSNSQFFESPLSGSIQTIEQAGSRWRARLSFPALLQDDARTMMAFLTQLRGHAGRFDLYDHGLPARRGAVSDGVGTVNGADQTGNSVILAAIFPLNQTGVFKAGDMISFDNGQLCMIVADADSTAGACTIQVEPPLRSSPGDLSAIDFEKPTATFMLSADSAQWATDPCLTSAFTITCIEAFT